MSGEKFLYFAYGSNLLKQRLQLKNPTAVYKTIAKLKNYRLTFFPKMFPGNSRWKGALATIKEELDSCVWGTVWELNIKDVVSLDRQENCYKAVNVDLLTSDNTTLSCRTYLLELEDIPKDWDPRPSPQYLDVIITGACQSSLPQDYINQLKQIEHNNFSGPVPIYEEVMKLLER